MLNIHIQADSAAEQTYRLPAGGLMLLCWFFS